MYTSTSTHVPASASAYKCTSVYTYIYIVEVVRNINAMTIIVFSVPLLPPFNVSGEGYDASSIYLSWEDIPLFGRNGILRGYRVFYNYVYQNNNSLGKTLMRDVNNSNMFQLILKDLTRDSEYNISVAGFTSVGIGVKSSAIKVATGIYG